MTIKKIMTKKFCVIRYKIEVFGECYWVWAEVTSPNSGIRDISRQRALELIREADLVCTLKCKHGEVYDTRDRQYYNEYHAKRNLTWKNIL